MESAGECPAVDPRPNGDNWLAAFRNAPTFEPQIANSEAPIGRLVEPEMALAGQLHARAAIGFDFAARVAHAICVSCIRATECETIPLRNLPDEHLLLTNEPES